jgi:hypothetical protein
VIRTTAPGRTALWGLLSDVGPSQLRDLAFVLIGQKQIRDVIPCGERLRQQWLDTGTLTLEAVSKHPGGSIAQGLGC